MCIYKLRKGKYKLCKLRLLACKTFSYKWKEYITAVTHLAFATKAYLKIELPMFLVSKEVSEPAFFSVFVRGPNYYLPVVMKTRITH